MTWYELDRARLVLEHLRVMSKYPQFILSRAEDSTLRWTGTVSMAVGPIKAAALTFRLEYPEEFPAAYPSVIALDPSLPSDEVGHAWHRWPRSGAICYVMPRDWQIGTTADEVISKIEDWYFNYVAVKRGLIGEMPDVGRATLPEEMSEDQCLTPGP